MYSWQLYLSKALVCLIAWSEESFISPAIMIVFRGNASGSLKECLNYVASQRRPFVVEESCTGAGRDLIHCCRFHSYLQNTMKSTIESKSAAFSSACFLERAELWVCCWNQAGKNQEAQRDASRFCAFSGCPDWGKYNCFFLCCVFLLSETCCTLKCLFFCPSTRQIVLTCLKRRADAFRHK